MKTRELGMVTIGLRTAKVSLKPSPAASGAKRLFSCGLTWATPSPRWQVNVHAASSARAFRRITCGGCPKARRKARRMR
jgi:hypothetical protein